MTRFTNQKLEKFLKVAEDIESSIEPPNSSILLKTHKISAKDLPSIKYLMQKEVIIFDPDDGRGLYTLPNDEIIVMLDEFYERPKKEKKAKTKSMTAIESVESVVTAEVAAEAHYRAAQYFELGKAVRGSALQYYESQGIPIGEATKYPLEHIVPEALEKAAKYDEEHQKRVIAENTIVQLSVLADPFGRLHLATQRLQEFAQFAVFCEKLGFDWRNAPVSKYFNALINKLVVGDG